MQKAKADARGREGPAKKDARKKKGTAKTNARGRRGPAVAEKVHCVSQIAVSGVLWAYVTLCCTCMLRSIVAHPLVSLDVSLLRHVGQQQLYSFE